MIRSAQAKMKIWSAFCRAKGVAGMDKPEDIHGIRFRRECAEQWRVLAASTKNLESQKLFLEIASSWDYLATEIESSLAAVVAEPSERERMT